MEDKKIFDQLANSPEPDGLEKDLSGEWVFSRNNRLSTSLSLALVGTVDSKSDLEFLPKSDFCGPVSRRRESFEVVPCGSGDASKYHDQYRISSS